MMNLHDACKANDIERVKFLLDSNIDVNIQDYEGLTALHHACNNNDNVELVKFLIDRGADLDIQDGRGFTVLHVASNFSDKIVKVLVDAGANINIKTNGAFGSCTSLHIACEKGNIKAVRILVENGADMDMISSNRFTALHNACASGKFKIVKILLDAKANINDNCVGYGDPHLSVASYSRESTKVVKLLLREGKIDVNFRDIYGETALFAAYSHGKFEATKVLISANADINSQNTYGETVLHAYPENCFFDMVKFIVDKGIDLNVKDRNGNMIVDKYCYQLDFRINRHGCYIYQEEYRKIIEFLLDRMDLNRFVLNRAILNIINENDVFKYIFAGYFDFCFNKLDLIIKKQRAEWPRVLSSMIIKSVYPSFNFKI